MPFKGAGATDRHSKLNNLRTLATLSGSLLLFGFVAWKGGVMSFVCAIAIEFAVYFAIEVGSRVESRTSMYRGRVSCLFLLIQRAECWACEVRTDDWKAALAEVSEDCRVAKVLVHSPLAKFQSLAL